MIDWIADHFSLNVWCASFDSQMGSFGLIGLGWNWFPEYREVNAELLGFGFALGYWPDDDSWEAWA